MPSLTSFEDVLDKDEELIFTNVGYSMYPLIKQREDILRIVKTATFKKGDIVLYKSNINEESAETDITIDSDVTKITTFIDLSTNSTAVSTLRKGHLKTDINNITNLGLNYGVRGYIKVQKDDEVTIIYTNAEVISWNSLNTYEKTLPYIWLTNED